MVDIIREPTPQDLSRPDEVGDLVGFLPLETPGGRVKTPMEKFLERLTLEREKAMKKGLPFCDAAARADVEDIRVKIDKELSRQGFVTSKIPTDLDWSKYSDLKNFEIIDEGEKLDAELTKHHRVTVNVRYKTYKFKGFKNTYTVMESGEEALQRALDLIESRKRG